MRNVFEVWLVLLFGALFSLTTAAQGTVNFSNVGGGIHAPVSHADTGQLLGAGWMAQLVNADTGGDIGEPAPFLVNGVFSGGTRIVDGILGGEKARLVVRVRNGDGREIGWSRVVEVVTGNSQATPPSKPTWLTGLTPWVVGSDTIQPPFTIPSRNPSGSGQAAEIQIRILTNGRLELRWPVGLTLVRADEPGGVHRLPVRHGETQDTFHVWSVSPELSQQFFWLTP